MSTRDKDGHCANVGRKISSDREEILCKNTHETLGDPNEQGSFVI